MSSEDSSGKKRSIEDISTEVTKKVDEWELSSGKTKRLVRIEPYKGTLLINIREYYEKDGELKPTSKGISLTKLQFFALKKHWGEICDRLDTLLYTDGQEPPSKAK